MGKELIYKLVEKQITIDLSHANEKTFWDIITVVQGLKKYNPKIIASHSNCKELCNIPRNLKDEQILAIKEVNGIIGLVSIKNFCKNTNNLNDNFEEEYIKHINYIKDILGGITNIGIATDDMSYYEIQPEYYKNINVYNLKKVANGMQEMLQKNGYTKEETEKILYKNAERILF